MTCQTENAKSGSVYVRHELVACPICASIYNADSTSLRLDLGPTSTISSSQKALNVGSRAADGFHRIEDAALEGKMARTCQVLSL
jgi:hypothetical protein